MLFGGGHWARFDRGDGLRHVEVLEGDLHAVSLGVSTPRCCHSLILAYIDQTLQIHSSMQRQRRGAGRASGGDYGPNPGLSCKELKTPIIHAPQLGKCGEVNGCH